VAAESGCRRGRRSAGRGQAGGCGRHPVGEPLALQLRNLQTLVEIGVAAHHAALDQRRDSQSRDGHVPANLSLNRV